MAGTRKPGGVKASGVAVAPATIDARIAELQQQLADVEQEASAAAVQGRARIAELEGRLAARVEGAGSPSTPKAIGSAVDILTQAQELAGDAWGEMRTWPLESGLIWLADKLKG